LLVGGFFGLIWPANAGPENEEMSDNGMSDGNGTLSLFFITYFA
jgi:hypothetical protein